MVIPNIKYRLNLDSQKMYVNYNEINLSIWQLIDYIARGKMLLGNIEKERWGKITSNYRFISFYILEEIKNSKKDPEYIWSLIYFLKRALIQAKQEFNALILTRICKQL